MKRFKGVKAYVEGKGVVNADICFDERIISTEKAEGEEIILPEGAIVVPGFIDLHIHGAGGSDTMDGSDEALTVICNTVAQEGTVGILATTMTQSEDNIEKALTAVKEYDGQNGARILGVHLEGPFISPGYAGAQPREYIVKPNAEQFIKYNKASGNRIKKVTVAPEQDGAEELIKYLKENGIIASVGHSDASAEEVKRAVVWGTESVTHTFNAQSPFKHRDIGVAGSAMLYDELSCEIIADGVHVSFEAIKLLVKNKPKDKITLITDAIRAKGLGEGESELGGQKVYVKDGQARLENGTLAGSVLKMNVAIKNMVEMVGVPFTQAIEYATKNPAKQLGIYQGTGSITVGKRADFPVLDKDYNVIMT
ncbi:MAG: N-acetylglucosamine-6-phosphate deacetylase, partial [Candidatus Coproplasma sp.]